MYKIKVKNNETGKIWWEYGCTKFIRKRIYFLCNDTYNDFFIYSVLEVNKITFSWENLKKCLTNTCEMCYN